MIGIDKQLYQPNGVGLVLEGGALRGVFTAGVLDYFMKKGLKLPYAVGVSAGACNLIGYASHQIGYTKNCMIQREVKNHYFGVNQLIHAKTIINLDRIFYEYPYNQLPFDFKAFFDSDIRTEFVVTNCDTGKAEYLSEVVIIIGLVLWGKHLPVCRCSLKWWSWMVKNILMADYQILFL